MDKLEMVQKVMECTGSSFADAKEALEATDYDVLEAIVALEKEGKSKTSPAFGGQAAGAEEPAAEEPKAAGRSTQRFAETWERLMDSVRRVCRFGLDTSFVAERGGRQVFTMPVLLFVLAIVLAFWVCVPLLIVGLFFDFRYRFKGLDNISLDVNAIADKAANFASDIKRDAAAAHGADKTER